MQYNIWYQLVLEKKKKTKFDETKTINYLTYQTECVFFMSQPFNVFQSKKRNTHIG